MSEPAENQRIRARLGDLRFVGEFTHGDAAARGLTLIDTAHGAEHARDHIHLTLLVDAQGIVVDARYRSLAVGAQLAGYDLLVERLIGKPLTECATITPAQIDGALRDDPATPALSLGDDRDKPYYVLVKAYERFHGAAPKGSEPAPAAAPSAASQLPWIDVGLFEKVRRIEEVLDTHVRPALASDGGGIDLVDLKAEELFVQYHGACGSCSSSIGGTLQFIQDSLNNHLGTTLAVRVTGLDEETPFTI